MNRACFDGIESVLFDFEGTLVDAQWNRTGAVQEALKKLHNLGLPAHRLQGRKLGILIREAMDMAPEFGCAPKEIKRTVNSILDRYDEDALRRWSLRPSLTEFLLRLRATGIRLGIVSNAGKSILEKALKKFGLKDFFETVVSRDDVQKLKPSGEGIRLALKQLRVSREHALYIGDTRDDIEAAREAGLKVALLQAEQSPSEDFLAARPDYFVNHFEELLNCLSGDFS